MTLSMDMSAMLTIDHLNLNENFNSAVSWDESALYCLIRYQSLLQ